MGVKLLSDELIGGVRYLWKSVIRWEESCTSLCCLFPNLILYYKVSVKIDIVSLVTEINVLGPLGMSGANRADKLSASTMDSSLGPFRMFKEIFPVD